MTNTQRIMRGFAIGCTLAIVLMYGNPFDWVQRVDSGHVGYVERINN